LLGDTQSPRQPTCSSVSLRRVSLDNHIRVVTWNIEHGQRVDRAIDRLTKHPHLADADLVLLQEMDDQGPEQIAQALGMTHQYFAGCTHTGTGRPFGNAILVRGSIDESEAMFLPHLARILGQRRIAVRGRVRLDRLPDASPVSVWSVHAEVSTLPHRRQVAQYRTVANSVDAAGTTRSIVAGDFNTASSRSLRALVEQMASTGLSRVNEQSGRTFTRFGRGFELDQIFARGFTTLGVGVVDDHGASDHDPVWATLRANY